MSTSLPSAASWRTRVAAIGRHPAFAYPTIFLLQARAIRGMWSFRDTTAADTASYVLQAREIIGHLRDDPIWSPLYQLYYASIIAFVKNPVVAAFIHRAAIILVVAVLVLALARSLLPPTWAWLVAAWWCVLPVQFNTLVEVHLFSVIVPLVAGIVAANLPTMRGRAVALSLLVADGILVRNEVLLGAAVFGVVCLLVEWRRRSTTSLRSIFVTYAVPLAIVVVVSLPFFIRSTAPPSYWRVEVQGKHNLNICQVYAFGFKQRHPEVFTKSPWTDCSTLMRQKFGKPLPNLVDAFVANPRAMAAHFAWNLRLAPGGLQELEFNRVAGGQNPDFEPSKLNGGIWVWCLSAVLVFLIGAGLVAARRRWRFWSRAWLGRRAWGWAVLFAVSLTCLFSMLVERPRPSYLFPLGITIQIAAGMAGFVLGRRTALRRMDSLLPAFAVLLVILVPRFYGQHFKNIFGEYEGKKLSEQIENVRNTTMTINSRNRFVALQFPFETCVYATGSPGCPTDIVDASSTLNERPKGVTLSQWLIKKHASYVYADTLLMQQPEYARLLDPNQSKWIPINAGKGWTIYRFRP